MTKPSNKAANTVELLCSLGETKGLFTRRS